MRFISDYKFLCVGSRRITSLHCDFFYCSADSSTGTDYGTSTGNINASTTSTGTVVLCGLNS